MQIESAKLAWCVGLFLSGPLWANDEPAAAAVNLVRDVSGAAAQVSVDSSFAGYRPDVLIDGHWLADGQETPRTFGDPDRLGNGGNTWVSSESAVEHWIQLTWPQDVQFNTVEIIWSQPEWKPQAVRMEYLVNERWMPLVPEVAGWEPIDRQSVVVAPVRATRSIRIVQPCGCAGSREFLAAQEVAVYRHGGERAASQGVRALSEQQMSRLVPKVPRQNIAQLHEDTAGAAIALSYRADGRTSPLPALVDGEMRVAAAVPESATAVGVEWPIRHVVEKASLTFSGATPAIETMALEFFDGQAWQTVNHDLTREVSADQGCLTWTFSPLATNGLRVRSTQELAKSPPSELAVLRYWPADKSTWPDRLTLGGVLQREVLAGDADPSFEQLAATALSMTPSRAFVGTPGDPHEIGVAWDGTILGRESISFLIGQPGYRLSEMRETLRQSLLGEWLPAIVTSARLGDVDVRQDGFSVVVGDSPTHTATYVRLQLKNRSDQPLACPIAVDMRSERAGDVMTIDRTLRRGEDVVLICLGSAATVSRTDRQSMLVEASIPAHGEATVDFVHPQTASPTAAELDACRALTYDQALVRFHSMWDVALRDVVRFELPEPHIQRMVRAVLAQLLINADGDIMPYGAARRFTMALCLESKRASRSIRPSKRFPGIPKTWLVRLRKPPPPSRRWPVPSPTWPATVAGWGFRPNRPQPRSTRWRFPSNRSGPT